MTLSFVREVVSYDEFGMIMDVPEIKVKKKINLEPTTTIIMHLSDKNVLHIKLYKY